MACTDILSLNSTKMFKNIRQGLEIASQIHTQNIIDIADDTLFVWDRNQFCILTLNWRSAQINGVNNVEYQTLNLSSFVDFEVERILVSKSCSLVCLAGPRGVAVVELPARFGKKHQFLNGAEKILCRSTNLCPRFFQNNQHLQVRQVRWHPASPTDSHLLVLLSDNTIRFYDSSQLLYVWQVGPIVLKNRSGPNSSTLIALGEAVVDFDFAPEIEYTEDEDSDKIKNLSATMDKTHISLNDSNYFDKSIREDNKYSSYDTKMSQKKICKRIEWPIVLLRENGNIYIMLTNFENKKHRLQGPLVITPQAVDNYGTESCSLIVIPSLPPTVIIAESNGRIHHGLLLDVEESEDSFNEVDESLLMEPVQWMLHIFETVELELGLSKICDHQFISNCSVYLKRDVVSDMRYFAYHNAGFHAITLYSLSELERFAESEIDNDITPLSASSGVEYILCTKIDSKERKVNAVLGFALHGMPCGLVALLGNGQVVSLKLVVNPKLLVDTEVLAKEKGVIVSKDRNRTEEGATSFVEEVQNILKRDISQPIISIDRNNIKLTNSESLEFLTQATNVLREQYKERHDKVADEFLKKIAHIHIRENQQKCEIEFLEIQIQQIRDNAHKMAEKFEEINERQEDYSKRCLNLVRESKLRISLDSVAEKEFIKNVEKVNNAVKAMKSSIKACKDTLNRQIYHVSKTNSDKSMKKFELPEKHSSTIHEILTALGSEIQNEVDELKLLQKTVLGN